MTAFSRDITDALKAFQEAYNRPPRWVLLESYLDGIRSRWSTREDQRAVSDYVVGFVDTFDEAVDWVRANPGTQPP